MKLNTRKARKLRTWWPRRVLRDRPKAAVYWFRDNNWELEVLDQTAQRFLDSFVVEEHPGYHCQWGWGMKTWRLIDGTKHEHDPGYTSIGCYQEAGDEPSHFEVRSEVVRGLVVNLCRRHLIEHFPEFAEAMGVTRQQKQQNK